MEEIQKGDARRKHKEPPLEKARPRTRINIPDKRDR